MCNGGLDMQTNHPSSHCRAGSSREMAHEDILSYIRNDAFELNKELLLRLRVICVVDLPSKAYSVQHTAYRVTWQPWEYISPVLIMRLHFRGTSLEPPPAPTTPVTNTGSLDSPVHNTLQANSLHRQQWRPPLPRHHCPQTPLAPGLKQRVVSAAQSHSVTVLVRSRL